MPYEFSLQCHSWAGVSSSLTTTSLYSLFLLLSGTQPANSLTAVMMWFVPSFYLVLCLDFFFLSVICLESCFTGLTFCSVYLTSAVGSLWTTRTLSLARIPTGTGQIFLPSNYLAEILNTIVWMQVTASALLKVCSSPAARLCCQSRKGKEWLRDANLSHHLWICSGFYLKHSTTMSGRYELLLSLIGVVWTWLWRLVLEAIGLVCSVLACFWSLLLVRWLPTTEKCLALSIYLLCFRYLYIWFNKMYLTVWSATVKSRRWICAEYCIEFCTETELLWELCVASLIGP